MLVANNPSSACCYSIYLLVLPCLTILCKQVNVPVIRGAAQTRSITRRSRRDHPASSCHGATVPAAWAANRSLALTIPSNHPRSMRASPGLPYSAPLHFRRWMSVMLMASSHYDASARLLVCSLDIIESAMNITHLPPYCRRHP